MLDGRVTGDERPGVDRSQDGALRPDDRALSDADVAGDAGLTRHHDVVLDDGAAGDADLRGEQRAAADRHAVRDVHEVVDLRSRADARLADRRTIDGRVRANLHVVLDDDAGMLRNLQVRAVLLPRETEAVAADDDAVVQRDAIADDDALANGRLGVNDAALADPRARTDHDVGVDDCACADRGAGADRDEWPDRHVRAYRRVARHGAQAIDALRRRRVIGEQRDGPRERRIRIVGVQHRAAWRRVAGPGATEDHGRRKRRRELREVSRIRDEREIALLRLLDARHADDLHVAVTLETAGQPFRNFP